MERRKFLGALSALPLAPAVGLGERTAPKLVSFEEMFDRTLPADKTTEDSSTSDRSLEDMLVEVSTAWSQVVCHTNKSEWSGPLIRRLEPQTDQFLDAWEKASQFCLVHRDSVEGPSGYLVVCQQGALGICYQSSLTGRFVALQRKVHGCAHLWDLPVGLQTLILNEAGKAPEKIHRGDRDKPLSNDEWRQAFDRLRKPHPGP